MKLLQKLTAGVLALSLITTMANAAPTVIDITGSSAFRKSAFKAIFNLLKAPVDFASTANSPSNDLGGAAAANIHGFTVSGNNEVIFRVAFSGSVGGIINVSQGTAPTFGFLPVGTPRTVGTYDGSSTTGGTRTYSKATINASTGAITDNDQSNHPTNVPVCFSDVFQETTGFTSTADVPYTSTDLNQNTVGVIAFQWTANNGSPANLTNISVIDAKRLFSNGSIPLSILTGVVTDRTTLVTPVHKDTITGIVYNGLNQAPVHVFAMGRDIDSGTRATALIEAGIGFGTGVIQFAPLDAGGNIITTNGVALDDQVPYPGETLNGFSYDPGNTGYNAGGDLASGGMSATGSLNKIGGYYITYLGTGDVGKVTGGHALTWNGVAYSATAVTEGQYSFWGYEHLDYIPSLADNSQFAGSKEKTITLLLVSQTTTDASAAGIALTSMHVKRSTDGDVITY